MAWIYIFDEGDCGTCKIGSARRHYHDRFKDQQPCNPRPLHLRAAFWFDDPEAMKACERAWKRGTVRPKVDDHSPHREWYRVSWREAVDLPVWSQHGGRRRAVEPFCGAFTDDLNAGARDREGREYHLMAYLLAEGEQACPCKLRFTAYGWKGVAQHYRTGNPHGVDIYGRWVWSDNTGAMRAQAALETAMGRHAIHYGWYRLPLADVAARIERNGGRPFAYGDGPDVITKWSEARFPFGDAAVRHALMA